MKGTPGPAARPVGDRLREKLIRTSTGRLEFTGALHKNGYGKISVGRNKTALAHRVAWQVVNGPIPDGLDVCHRCDNRRCCNVEHLFLGTRSDNIRDAVSKGRHHNAAVTHCPQGHEYDEANTHIRRAARGRTCLACLRERGRQRYWAAKADSRVQQ